MKRFNLHFVGAAIVVLLLGNRASAQIQVGSDFEAQITNRNVGGALSYLPDGDVIAFSIDYANGPALYRFDANGDGVPTNDIKVLKQYDGSVFANFVQTAPSGSFAIAGIGGFDPTSFSLLRIDLVKDEVLELMPYSGNFDLAFLNDSEAYVSANPLGFDPSGPNEISLVQLSNPPVVTPVVRIFGAPSGPISLNADGDLYYIKGAYFPATGGTLLRFSAAKLAQAAVTGVPLVESDSEIAVPTSGGYDLVFHRIGQSDGEFFFSTFSNQIFHVRESSLALDVFAEVNDPSFFAVTGLSFLNPDGRFDASGPADSELAASVSDFAASQGFLQIRPVTFEPVTTDQNGECISGATDCIHESLESSACVGANGFLTQINIASVVNLRAADLKTRVEYFDITGVKKGEVNSVIKANLKQDFLINELGLEPDTIGTVCVSTDGLKGSWSGGIALYKPDLRNGVPPFGDAFDFALYYPFLNPFEAPVTVPLNTYHLGVSPSATVANWIAIIDADRDGAPLTGRVVYFDAEGNVLSEEAVNVPDGGRRDLAGHAAIGGSANNDAVGMAQFVPDKTPAGSNARFYLHVTRYFYDCPGSSCQNFLTAFNVPNRPGSADTISGGTSTAKGELSIVELTNVSSAESTADMQVLAEDGTAAGTSSVFVPRRGTVHTILNRSGQEGFLTDNSVATTSVRALNGKVSAVSLFYKLNEAGVLEYAYAAPFAGSPGIAQVAQFNSFINQTNIPEVFNSSSKELEVTVLFYSFDGTNTVNTKFGLKPLMTKRLETLPIRPNDYGTVIVQGSGPGLVVRNYVQRAGMYTMAFGAE